MKIASANLQMASTHVATQERQVKESLRMWVGNSRPDFEGSRNERSTASAAARVQISDSGRQTQSEETKALDDIDEQVEQDPKLRLLRSVIELLTGRKVKVFDARELRDPGPETAQARDSAPANNNRAAGYGIEYDYHESYSETETTTFAAQGTVRTEDGQEISFNLNLAMRRSYYEESNVSIRQGDAVMKDPLVINFNGNATQLTDTRFRFDLDADGLGDNINFVAPGSGFLVFDRNKDGKINDGREMFGALTGDGFAELAKLDEDNNGWIDENDSAYKDLQVWSKDAEGKDQLQSLQDADVGAISLAHVGTSFDMKNENNELEGKIRSTGVFLRESGGAGTIQKIDLSV